jgi:hypothetical protein
MICSIGLILDLREPIRLYVSCGVYILLFPATGGPIRLCARGADDNSDVCCHESIAEAMR